MRQTMIAETPDAARRRALRELLADLERAEAERDAADRQLMEVEARLDALRERYRLALAEEWVAANGVAAAPAPASAPTAEELMRVARDLPVCYGGGAAAEPPEPPLPSCPDGCRVLVPRVGVEPGMTGVLLMRYNGDIELHCGRGACGDWDELHETTTPTPDIRVILSACREASGLALKDAQFIDDLADRVVFSLECPAERHPEAWRLVRLSRLDGLWGDVLRQVHLDNFGDLAHWLGRGMTLAGIKGVGKDVRKLAFAIRKLWEEATVEGRHGGNLDWVMRVYAEADAAAAEAVKKEKKPRKEKPRADAPQQPPAPQGCAVCGTCYGVTAGTCRRCAGAKALGPTAIFVGGDVGDLTGMAAWERADGSLVLRAKEFPGEVESDEELLADAATAKYGRGLRVDAICQLDGDHTHPVVIELKPLLPAAPERPDDADGQGDLFGGDDSA